MVKTGALCIGFFMSITQLFFPNFPKKQRFLNYFKKYFYF